MLQPEDSKRVADAVIEKVKKINIVEALEFAAKAFAGAKDDFSFQRFDTRIEQAVKESISKWVEAKNTESLRFDERITRAIKEGLAKRKE